MKNYLSLIPISAKVRKRQNRMTILCIIISVFLVTAIFSVADMMIRTQFDRMTDKHGIWHLKITDLSPETAQEIEKRDDVISMGKEILFNADGELPWRLNERRVVIYGIDESYLTLQAESVIEGHFPQNTGEIMLGTNAANVLQVTVGDTVTLHTPSGEQPYQISALGGVDTSYYNGQYALMDTYLPYAAFVSLLEQTSANTVPTTYYIQFTNAKAAAEAIPQLTAQYQLPENAIKENTAIMALAGQSDNSYALNIYAIAVVLFVLVLLSGVLMISGSLNSNLAQRVQFFGMMRCIGMSKSQIIRFVRLEALNWCKSAVPIGVLSGTFSSWIVCAILRYGIGGEFSTTPVFKFSFVGMISGILVGIITVLLSAEAPARRAARISPVAAVSGNSGNISVPHRTAKFHLGNIEQSLGIHHAIASKKNLFSMTASFALSIILVLCFSVLLQFAGLLMPGQTAWQPDLLIDGYANENILSDNMAEELRSLPGIRSVWSSASFASMPASSPQTNIDHIVFCSYDDFMLEESRELVSTGRLADSSTDSNEVMTICNKENPLSVGDTVSVNGTELTIVGTFTQGLFSDDIILICPQALFERVTGVKNYNLMGILLDNSATEQTVMKIARLSTDEIIVTDLRKSNSQNTATYLASRLVVWGILAIIGLISLFHIVNSISMSVSARIKQYGIMRAVGMDNRQLTRMIAAEAFTYALFGLITGCTAGLLLSRMLYLRLITPYFGLAWHIPGMTLIFLILAVLTAAAIAVYSPAKRIRSMEITETINEL